MALTIFQKEHLFFSLFGGNMKINPVSTLLVLFGLVFTTLATTFPAHAVVAASIHPADALDNFHIVTDPSYINHNPGLSSVINGEGYTHTTSVEVNANTGTIKGYSGYSLGTSGSVTRTNNLIDTIAGSSELALVSNTSGHIIYNHGTLSGPGSVSNAYAKISINVDGSFNYLNGSPAMGLLGSVLINVTRGGTSMGYNVGASFSNIDSLSFIPDSGNVFTRQDLQVFDSFGNIVLNPNISGINWGANFLSVDPNSLSMQISLMIPVQVGDQLQFGGTAAGTATHAFLEDFRNLAVGNTGNVDTANGYVDFMNTATLNIELPQGFTLEGSDVPNAIISHTPVPLPSSSWLFLTGIVSLVGGNWQRNKLSA